MLDLKPRPGRVLTIPGRPFPSGLLSQLPVGTECPCNQAFNIIGTIHVVHDGSVISSHECFLNTLIHDDVYLLPQGKGT